MKSAKFMLTSLVVLAIAGGALAFNVKSTGFYIYKKAADGQSCPLFDQVKHLINSNGTSVTSTFTSTDNTLSPDPSTCTSTIKVVNE